MRIKLLIVILVVFTILSGCKSSVENNKEKYDSAINQVITLENERIAETEILKRKNVGIIVYDEGKYIELIHEKKISDRVESMYELNAKKEYKYITKKNLDKILVEKESVFKKTSYTENVGLK